MMNKDKENYGYVTVPSTSELEEWNKQLKLESKFKYRRGHMRQCFYDTESPFVDRFSLTKDIPKQKKK